MRSSILFLLFVMIFSFSLSCFSPGFATEAEIDHAKDDSMSKHMNHGSAPSSEKDAMTKHLNMDHSKPPEAETDLSAKVRVDEKLGNIVDLNTWFFDEHGKKVKIKSFFDKPVIILPVYYFCPTVCNFLQADLAEVLNQVDQIPGKDFNVISLSFSDDENHTHAADTKRNYAKLITRDFPVEQWAYLTGTKENIKQLTDSLGFFFIKKEKHLYVHPNVLVVLSKDGKITRYVYGPNFLSFDVGMALSEANQGLTGASIKRGVLSFCFNYDPGKKTYVLNIFRITGTIILVFLVGFIVLLIFIPRKKKEKTWPVEDDT
jgi:protein SCO1